MHTYVEVEGKFRVIFRQAIASGTFVCDIIHEFQHEADAANYVSFLNGGGHQITRSGLVRLLEGPRSEPVSQAAIEAEDEAIAEDWRRVRGDGGLTPYTWTNDDPVAFPHDGPGGETSPAADHDAHVSGYRRERD